MKPATNVPFNIVMLTLQIKLYLNMHSHTNFYGELFMNKNIIVAAIILLTFAFSTFSGCSERQNTTDNDKHEVSTGSIETISVGTAGGQFSFSKGNVEVNLSSGSVSTQTSITVKPVQNPVQDPSLNLLSCYEFGPDGQVFNRPVDIIIHYNQNTLPQGLQESDLKIYELNGNTWKPIKDSFANLTMHYAVAKVSHFCKMGCAGVAAPPGEETNKDSTSEDQGEDGSAQYWFKADLNFYNTKTLRLADRDDDDMYGVGVCAYWKPVSYVQYYEVKFIFNGNTPENYAWHCDYRDQGKDICDKNPSPYKEGYIFRLGGDPNLQGFIGLYDTKGVATASKYDPETGKTEYFEYGRLRPEGTHGFNIVGFYDTVEDIEKLSDLEKGSLVSRMQTFLLEYVNGWEVWVRGVTERGD
jgi:hypothetical protein